MWALFVGIPKLFLMPLLMWSLPPSSMGLCELSPVLSCGSLHLLLSVIGWSFYDENLDSHQYDYWGRPVQAPSPPMLRVFCGSSLWIPGNFPSARFLDSPIMTLSIKICLSWLSLSVLPLSWTSCSLIFSIDHHGLKLEFKNNTNCRKPANSWKLTNAQLNQPWAKEEIKKINTS